MNNNNNGYKRFETQEEMTKFLLEEIKRASIRESFKYKADPSDIESYLVGRVWTYICNHVKYQSRIGIRAVIKSHCLNFVNSNKDFNTDVKAFSTLNIVNEDGSEVSFEESYASNEKEVGDKVADNMVENEFLNSLSDLHRQILDLKMTGISQKKLLEVLFPNSSYETGKKRLQREMKAIIRKANAFKLDEI